MNLRDFINGMFKNKKVLTNVNVTNGNIKNDNKLSKQELIYLIKEFKLTDKIITNEMKNNIVLNFEEVEIDKIEKVLKEYITNNQEEKRKLKEELEILDYVEKTSLNRDKLLEKINMLELKYKLFQMFDNSSITKEELEKLYKVKFDILVTDINNLRTPIININTNSLELECYIKIVEEKILTILKDENIEFINIFGKNKHKALSLIQDILKNKNSEIDIKDILNHPDPIILALLLSFDKDNGFDKFLNEYKLKSSELYFVYFYGDVFEWEDELPINTILEIIEDEELITEILFEQLLKLKKISPKKEENNYYKLPDGLKKINKSLELADNYKFIKKIRNNIYNKIIITPSSLKEIKGYITNNWFEKEYLAGLKLNEGLTAFNHLFENNLKKELTIPSTLEKFGGFGIVNRFTNVRALQMRPKILKFTNYEDSLILNDIEKLSKLIGLIFYKYYRSTGTGYREKGIRTEIEKIILVSKYNDKEIIIDCAQLKVNDSYKIQNMREFNYYDVRVDELDYYEIKLIVEEFKNILNEKSNKDIKILKRTIDN